MANGVQLATAYVSLNVNTNDLGKQIRATFKSMQGEGQVAGRAVGNNLANSLKGSLGSRVSGKQLFGPIQSSGVQWASNAGRQIGSTLGNSISGAVRSAGRGVKNALSAIATGGLAAAGIGAGGLLGSVLFSGLERLKKIDQARFKLNALGNSAADVDSIMSSALKSVDKTAFSLADAASAAASAVAAGIKPGEQLTTYLTTIGDAAAVAGTSFDEMGSIFNRVRTNTVAYTDDIQMLADRGIPIFQWLQEEYQVTGGELRKMITDGKVDAATFETAIAKRIGGAAKTMGQSFSGAVDNLNTAMSRVGASLITALMGTGGSGDPMKNAAAGVEKITEKFNELDRWIQANQGKIREFFSSAKDIVLQLAESVGKVLQIIKDYPTAVAAVVTAFGAWNALKFTGLLSAIGGVSNALGGGKFGLLGKLGLVLAAMGAIDKFTSSGGAVNAGPDFGSQAAMAGGGALIGGQFLGIPGAAVGGLLGAAAAPVIDMVQGGQPAQNGVLPTAPNSSSVPTVGGIPIPGLGSGSSGGQAAGRPGGGLLGSGFQSNNQFGMAGTPGQGFPMRNNSGGLFGNAGLADTGIALNPGNFSVLDKLASGQFGLTMSSGFRSPTGPSIYGVSADKSYHGSGRAHDYAGNPQQMLAFANYMASTFGSQLKELIFDHPAFAANINNGRVVGRFGQFYTLDQAGPHHDHVHVAFADGGKVSGPGTAKSDSIPAMLSNGEHVLTAGDVQAMGGQQAVYQFRRQLHNSQQPMGHRMFSVGGTPDEEEKLPKQDSAQQSAQSADPSEPVLHGQNPAPPGPLSDPAVHGQSGGVAPGPVQPTPELDQQQQTPTLADGFVPVAAGNTGVAGTSSLAGIIDIGNQVVGGLIDTGAQLAQTAVSAAAAAGGFGAGAAAAPAASAGIQIGATIAKRAASFGFQAASIGADALIAQLFPFGAPRWIGYDYLSFVPQNQMSGTMGMDALATGATDEINNQFAVEPPQPQSPESPDQMVDQAAPNAGLAPTVEQPAVVPPTNVIEDPRFIPPFAGGGAVKIYDQGGILKPGELALNASRKPEKVLTDKQWDALAKIQPAQSGPLVKIDAIYGMSPEDVASQIESKQRLAMMRFTGRP